MSVPKVLSVILCCVCVCAAPFSAFAKEKEPKVSELLKDANEVMSQASASYVDGDSKAAIELYRKALAEIARVEQENATRAPRSEFAPVRFRKALCETEIDRIMLEEINSTARTMAVTDTTELETKRAARHKVAETNNVPEAAVKLAAKQGVGEGVPNRSEADEHAEGPAAPLSIHDELEWAKDMLSVDRFDDVDKALLKILKKEPAHHDARLLMALARVQQNRNGDAAVVLDDLLQDNPNDEPALLLAAGSCVAAGNYAKAMTALDKCLKVNPKRPDAYHNMAWLLLEMKTGKVDEPEMYYRQAVKLGGPRDRDLERRLGIKSE